MRKLTVAALAIPVLATVYAGSLLRRFVVARVGVALAMGAVIGLGAIGIVRPTATTATPPTDIVPLTQAAFRTSVATAVEVDAPVTIEFTTAMDPASVASSITVEPATEVALHWDPSHTTLTITPEDRWAAGAYHTVTVQPGALALTGRPTTTPARSSFLTRDVSTAVLGVTEPAGRRVTVDTAFTVAFERSVDVSTLRAGIRLDPPVEGELSTSATVDGLVRAVFTPSAPLAADTRYELVVDGVIDDDGLPLATSRLAVRTTVAPEVVRFRPRHKADDMARDDAISVRFTRSMDRAATKAAFSVTVDGDPVDGKIRFAEDDTVLVFVPAKKLPYDAKVVARVAATAVADDGAELAEAASATFRTVPKPKPASRASTTPITRPSGGSAGSGSWTAVERYYLGLMNCTRTGGTVTSGGDCASPGGRDVAPLKLSAGISNRVARPYAKLLATRGLCSHFIGGNPGDRLRRAGYTSYRWAENLGCRSGNPYSAVLGSHRYFQSERSWSPQGGHYVNLMNAKYDRAGIGVWVSGGRVRLVVDFYHP